MTDPNLARWIWASVSKSFDDRKGSMLMFFEGDDRNTAKDKDFTEFRMDGPRSRNPSHNYSIHDIFVNILITSTMDSRTTHRYWSLLGQVAALFIPCIKVMKYGEGPDDDPTVQIGILQLKADGVRGQQLTTATFGQVDPTVRVQQATIEGQYTMEISE